VALTAVAQARAESEARLGREAAAARRTSTNILKEALALPSSAFSPKR